MSQQDDKRAAAYAAHNYLRHVDILGVGTGSTVDLFIDSLIDYPQYRSAFEHIISSSERTTQRLKKLGLTCSSPNHVSHIDLYIDGADQCTRHGSLIKGGGGALTHEKILAAMAKRFVCLVDHSKLAPVLGSFPLPIEVIPAARSFVARQLVKIGGQPALRPDFTTEHGNVILDVSGLELTQPQQMEDQLNQLVGVVCHGLFARRGADILLLAKAGQVTTITI